MGGRAGAPRARSRGAGVRDQREQRGAAPRRVRARRDRAGRARATRGARGVVPVDRALGVASRGRRRCARAAPSHGAADRGAAPRRARTAARSSTWCAGWAAPARCSAGSTRGSRSRITCTSATRRTHGSATRSPWRSVAVRAERSRWPGARASRGPHRRAVVHALAITPLRAPDRAASRCAPRRATAGGGTPSPSPCTRWASSPRGRRRARGRPAG